MNQKSHSMLADENGEVTCYMCTTDWECELGAASGGNVLFPSLADAEKHLRCAKDCGIVAVKVRFVEVVTPGLCEECGQNVADSPSRICVGCEAYHDHQC